MIPQPPSSTLLPYTTLFRSKLFQAVADVRLRNYPKRTNKAKPRRAIFHRQSAAARPLPNIPVLIRVGRTKNPVRSEEHTSELQSQSNLVCRLLIEKKNTTSY